MRGKKSLRWLVNVKSYFMKNTVIIYNKVGEQVTAEDCKRRWKALRDKFVREIKEEEWRRPIVCFLLASLSGDDVCVRHH